jgi:hypothetical protein
MTRKRATITVLAAIMAIFMFCASGAYARGPVITSVKVANKQATYNWSLPSGVRSVLVETSSTYTTNDFGYFDPPSNVYNFNATTESQTSLVDEREYPPGTYYIHIGGLDRATKGCHRIEFSAIMIFVVDSSGNGSGTAFTAQPPACTGSGGGGSGGDRPAELVKYSHRQDVDKLFVRARMDEVGTLTANASITIGKSTKLYRFLSVTRSVAADRYKKLRLKLKRHDLRVVKRALKQGRSLRARITVIARNRAGASISKRVSVRLHD